jgi:hypothetical protein
MSGVGLKLVAAVLTLAAVAGSAVWVAGHQRNPSAPLRPPVAAPDQGVLVLGPSVEASDVQPVTSTYAS